MAIHKAQKRDSVLLRSMWKVFSLFAFSLTHITLWYKRLQSSHDYYISQLPTARLITIILSTSGKVKFVAKSTSVKANFDVKIPFEMRKHSFETMPQDRVHSCRPLCRYCLILVQCRFFRSWLQATVTMLENTLALHAFTLETPWDYFSPMAVHQKIRMFSDELEQNLARINFLTVLTTIGCNFCRQLWSLKVVVSTNFE